MKGEGIQKTWKFKKNFQITIFVKKLHISQVYFCFPKEPGISHIFNSLPGDGFLHLLELFILY